MLPGPAVPGCCLISFHFLWAIHPIRPVQWGPTVFIPEIEVLYMLFERCHTLKIERDLSNIIYNTSISVVKLCWTTLSFIRAEYLALLAWMMPISFLVRESVPEHWLHWQRGAQAVNVACLVWLLATLVLSSGYSGTLLSSLMMNYYERPGCSSGTYDCILPC